MNLAASLLLTYALNALWQLPLFLAAAWLATRLIRGRSLRLEQNIWTGALNCSVLFPALSALAHPFFAGMWRRLTDSSAHGTVTVTIGPAVAASSQPERFSPQFWLSVAAVLALTILFFAARLCWNLARTWELLRRSTPASLTPEQSASVRSIAQRLGIGHACVAVSERVFGPVTIGLLHPSILVPAGWLESVALADFEAAITHECAHIQRHDFARNLFLELRALPIAWHPLLPLLRARLAESREMLCDSLAADTLGSPDSYARSLVRLASHLANGKPARTLHAIGIFDATSFERRVMQLTHRPLELRGFRRVVVTAGCATLTFGAFASAFALHLDGPAIATSVAPHVTPAPAPTPSPQPVAVAPTPAPALAAAPRRAAAPLPAPVPDATVIASAQQSAPLPPPPPPPARPANAQRVSEGVMAGVIVFKTEPVYPPIARAAHVSGNVLLHVIIGEDGAPKSIQAVEGPEMLKGAALEAVKEWRWKPYLLNGQPTPVDTTITVTFDPSK